MRTQAGYFFGAGEMKFTKPPLSIDDQIALLEGRGMVIGDVNVARHALAHYNYYRLRGYWIVLEEAVGDGTHRFRSGATLQTALALYAFDEALRGLLMEAIARVEVSIRTQFAHQISGAHGAHAYLNQSLFHDAVKHASCLTSLREEVQRSHEVFIKHYLNKYSDPELPPLWSACEVMSLGSLSKWYENLVNRSDRKLVSDVYDLDETTLSSFLHHLTTLRNLCAHHGRVWNRRFTVTMRIPRNRPVHAVRAFYEDRADPGAARRIYNSLTMLGHLMRVVAPESDWLIRLRTLLETTSEVDPTALGFPVDWRNRQLWRNAV